MAHHGDQTCHSPSNNYPHTSPQSHNRKQARSETVDTISERTQHTCLRLEPRGMVQTGLLELVGHSDSNWADDSATRQSDTGQNVTTCNRSLKQTAISQSSNEAEFYAASACAEELLGLAELFKELHHSAGDRADSNTSKYDAWQYNSGYERNIWMDCERSRWQRNLDFKSWMVRSVHLCSEG